ncbi:unnamed protein product [Callosobruchus maculatus]|uniref:Chitin-binding type-2 domain-containing protein n=1 Tax=Callosobruchus maculatus TaxID=64391 RepID=A0A653BLK5_CALMS|nr:unnamed protein product [Callosobruchus maculatus]
MIRYHTFKLGIAMLFCATCSIGPTLVISLEENSVVDGFLNSTEAKASGRLEDLVFYQGMEGTPGIDFPILSYIPRTSFSCKGIESGYYADLETDCQVFHICEEERKISFLCPNGTIFQQSELICEWWFKVNCTNSPQLYEGSAEHLREDLLRRKSARKVSLDGSERFHGAVMRTEESSSVSAKQNGRILPISPVSDKHNSTLSRRSDNPNVRQVAYNYNAKFENGRSSPNQYQYTRSPSNAKNSFNSNHFGNVGQNGKGISDLRQLESQDQRRAESGSVNNVVQNNRNVSSKYNTQSQLSSKSPNLSYNDYSTIPSSKGRYSNKPQTDSTNIKISNQFNNNVQSSTSNDDSNNQSSDFRYSSNSAKSNIHHQDQTHKPKGALNSYNVSPTTTIKYSNRGSKKFETQNSDSKIQEQNAYSNPTDNNVIKLAASDNVLRQSTSKLSRYNDLSAGNSPDTVRSKSEKYVTTTPPFNNYKEYHVQFSSTRVGVNSVATTITPLEQQSISQKQNTYDPTNTPYSSNDNYFNTQYQRNNGVTATMNVNNHYRSVQFAPDSNNYSSYSSNVRKSITYNRNTGSQITKPPQTKTQYYNKKSEYIPNQYYTTVPTSTEPTASQQNLNNDYNRNQYYVSNSKNENSDIVGRKINNKDKLLPKNEVSYQDYAQTVSDFTLAISTNANKNIRNQRYGSESADSDEAQIPQESSSFVKSSFNTITDDLQKYSTSNPYPNHRTTYSGLKQPTYPPKSNKLVSISSVTPQYITTQPINNGKPFLGSRVGAKIHFGTTTEPPISSTTIRTLTTVNSVIPNVYVAEENKKLAQVLLDSVKISPSSEPSTTSPTSTTYQYSHSTPIPREAEYYSASTTIPVEKVTSRTVDHATIYGTYQGEKHTPTASFKESSNGVQVKFGKNADRIALTLGKSLTRGRSERNEYYDTKASTISPEKAYLPTSYREIDNLANTYKPSNFTRVGKPQNGYGYVPISFNNASSKYSSAVQSPFLNANIKVSDVHRTNPNIIGTGFYVTKKSAFNTSYPTTQPSLQVYSTTLRPKPFEKSLQYSIIPLSTSDNFESVTIPNYRISSASPFRPYSENNIIPDPTIPTPVTSTSIYDNADSMINALVKFAESKEPNYSSEKSRPGLSVPPSVGPQTLHTLAVYFANALDSIMKDKEKLTQEEMIEKKEELTTLLTEMTVHGYNNLFNRDKTKTSDSTTLPPKEDDDAESSNGLANTPEIRQLARNFSLALASYLNDPEMFKKGLAELRPTEPSFYEEETEHTLDNEEAPTDEELLNYSDADGKSSYPPIPSPSPTWGFILATKSNDIDVKNSLNSDLNTADSQSLIPSYNNLNQEDKNKDTNDKKYLPEGHWTTSATVAKLWSSTFGVNPAVVNEQFETTVTPLEDDDIANDFSSPEKLPILDQPQDEIKYEIRTLPKISLNSTQIHGILIDFMNTSSSDSNRLHRLLRKLNTTENEFLNKMKEIESNPLTKRLILLLISECGMNVTKDVNSDQFGENLTVSETKSAIPVPSVESLVPERPREKNSPIPNYVNEHLSEDDQDVRALQLLNALYGIASKFGK